MSSYLSTLLMSFTKKCEYFGLAVAQETRVSKVAAAIERDEGNCEKNFIALRGPLNLTST
jgi:hypothetical protein